MNETLQDFRNQLTQLWQGLGWGQRIAIMAIGVGAIALIFAVVTWARTPEYASAFSNLSETDAAAVVAKLKDAKIDYELANGGSAIRVPASQLYDARLMIASSGLPQGGGVGFEIFNQTNFGMTDFSQKVNYQRALEGELSRTINHLGPVDQSRVHIVIPQPSLYTDNQTEASASVVLMLKPGQHLTQNQVQGISLLVSSSVEGLKPQNLTIVDANGNILSDGQGAGKDPQKVGTGLLDAERNFEGELEQKAQSMLDKVLGPGKANVGVHAVMDWDQFESNSEIYSPANTEPQIRSSHLITEVQQDGGLSAGGVPGVVSNVPGYTGVVSGTSSSSGAYGRSDATVNYELSKTVEKLIKSPGSIKNLSVAVVLDGSQPLEQERIDSISRLISATVGLDETRGDTLAIASIPFDRSAFADDRKAIEEAQQRDSFLQNAKLAAMALGPVLLLLFVFILLRRQRPRSVTRVREVSEGVRQLAPTAAGAALSGGGQPALAAAPEPVIDVAELLAKEAEKNRVQTQLSILAKSQPETVAMLIKTWLEEDNN